MSEDNGHRPNDYPRKTAALAAADERDMNELPDDLRAPLHAAQADLDWIVARITTEDEAVQLMLKQAMRSRLSQIEEAAYRLNAALAAAEEEVEHFGRLAFVDLGANPVVS